MTGELRRAAFGDLPAPVPALLTRAQAPRAKLLAAIVLGAQGRYAAAAALLTELGRERDPVVAAHSLTTLASHRRQLGGHAAARPRDAAALRLASSVDLSADAGEDPDGLDARGALADALLGLAADSVGAGRPAVARRFASAAAPHLTSWRTRVRAGWVAAEIEFVDGRPAAAVDPAETAFQLATAAGASRHVVKSGLVLAAALAETGAVDRARDLVSDAVGATEKYELRSLAWPACLLAARLWPETANHHRFRVDAVLHAVLLRSDPEGRRLAGESPWVPV
ncbi:hypothetical protein [Amycolatopsis pigmentata]|uniref:Uncharacterized protein n=1 Tax=Amycolatopsis pigmentata TaxID=450801 RepID=A0ABW5G6T3_9PSEU